MNKLYLLLFLMLFIPLVSAVDTEDIFKFEQELDYKQQCFNNGTFCSPTATCNATITSPNSSILIDNKLMTNNVAYHNITIPSNSLNVLGIYKVDIPCIDNGLTGSDTFYFKITPSGDEISTAQGIVYSVLFVLSVVVLMLTMYGSFSFPWRNQRNEEGEIIGVNELKYLKLFCIAFSYVLTILINWMAYTLAFGYLSFDFMANFFYTIYWILLSLLFPFLIIMVVIVIIKFIDDRKIWDAFSRGIVAK